MLLILWVYTKALEQKTLENLFGSLLQNYDFFCVQFLTVFFDH